MNFWILLPLINGVALVVVGWILTIFIFRPRTMVSISGLKLQGLVWALKPKLARLAASQAENFLDDPTFLNEKLSGALGGEKLRNILDEKIDDFLKNKLTQTMPMLSMFLTEGTVTKVKGVLLEELMKMLPGMAGQMVSQLTSEVQIGKIVEEKILNIPDGILEKNVRSVIAKKLAVLLLILFLAGCLSGLLTATVFSVIK